VSARGGRSRRIRAQVTHNGRVVPLTPDGKPVADPRYTRACRTNRTRIAARRLHYVGLLRDVSHGSLSGELRQAVNKVFKTARDATAAYRIDWPPRRLRSAADAYPSVRFSTNSELQGS
jgi:hypothetical protein